MKIISIITLLLYSFVSLGKQDIKFHPIYISIMASTSIIVIEDSESSTQKKDGRGVYEKNLDDANREEVIEEALEKEVEESIWDKKMEVEKL
ncbi:hypothetical protein RJT34_07290 [Clitoria ternatea]|uniref:Uncharacterized protein n=1 Tax=Clitoria ternatea TaxID=43366 RepID=A0AAN9PTY7_CLITE